MTLPRFFISKEQIIGNQATILGEDAHHIKNVLRLKTGDKIIISDGENREFEGLIQEIKDKTISTTLSPLQGRKEELSLEITLAQALVKESKMDLILNSATQLGVTKFIPVITERSIIKLDEEKSHKRLLRWQKIIKEASQQSQRKKIPQIEKVTSFNKLLKTEKFDLKIIPWELEEKVSLKKLLKDNIKAQKIIILIGPEGGFSQKEAEKAKASGFHSVSLGKRILRVETAAITTLANLNYEFR